MKDRNIIQEKTFLFAIRIVNAYKFLVVKKKEFVLSKQLLRCGTSIGANTEEAIGGQTEKDFFAKWNIVYKEARETHYWIRLLKETNYFSENEAISLLNDCTEILKIVGSIIKTMKQKINS